MRTQGTRSVPHAIHKAKYPLIVVYITVASKGATVRESLILKVETALADIRSFSGTAPAIKDRYEFLKKPSPQPIKAIIKVAHKAWPEDRSIIRKTNAKNLTKAEKNITFFGRK
ncbi:hypothetical protein HVA01_01830 [Halovibrio variabilis]|uniref:Uncharacterized protein n=1 Tax=Halovibrio variabilis TaxID=31910 RepID=A0A511UIX1_9GAMM|nr:hypothetical protein HVA01_01830 [Halovibrio variabilis]